MRRDLHPDRPLALLGAVGTVSAMGYFPHSDYHVAGVHLHDADHRVSEYGARRQPLSWQNDLALTENPQLEIN